MRVKWAGRKWTGQGGGSVHDYSKTETATGMKAL